MSENSVEMIKEFPTDSSGFVLEKYRDQIFKLLKAQKNNHTCFDCQARNPTWLSLTYAIYVCLSCSGSHRQMGSHLSFARSCLLDQFTKDQLIRMTCGGNLKAYNFFKENGCMSSRNVADYHSKAAAKYKQHLDELVMQAKTDKYVPLQDVADIPLEAESLDSSSTKILQNNQENPEPESSPKVEVADYLSQPASWPIAQQPSTSVTKHAQKPQFTSRSYFKATKLTSDFEFEKAAEDAKCGLKNSLPNGSQEYVQEKFNSNLHSTSVPNLRYNYVSQAQVTSSPESQRETARKFHQYRNSTAISSDSFFNDTPNTNSTFYPNESLESKAAAAVSELTDQAKTTVINLANTAVDGVNKAKTWISDRVSNDLASRFFYN